MNSDETRVSCRRIDLDEMPRVAALVALLDRHGFQVEIPKQMEARAELLVRNRAERTASVSLRTGWFVCRQPSVSNDGFRISFNVKGSARRLPDLLATAAPFFGPDVYAECQVLPGGKGLRQRAREVAARIVERAPFLPDNAVVYVPTPTRGGRGGFREKVAYLRFKVGELLPDRMEPCEWDAITGAVLVP